MCGMIWRIRDPVRLQGEQRRAEVTIHLLSPEQGDIVLDVGCGDGYQISYVLGRASQIFGIDISKASLKEAKKRVKGVDFVCACSENLPFRYQVFSKVMCLELLEHLEDPSKTLEEIGFVLKQAGALIISVPYREHIITTQCIHCGRPTPLWGHLHSFDEKNLSSILPKNFEILQCVYTGTAVAAYPIFGFLPGKLWKFVDNLSQALPHVKPSWFISKIKKNQQQ